MGSMTISSACSCYRVTFASNHTALKESTLESKLPPTCHESFTFSDRREPRNEAGVGYCEPPGFLQWPTWFPRFKLNFYKHVSAHWLDKVASNTVYIHVILGHARCKYISLRRYSICVGADK